MENAGRGTVDFLCSRLGQVAGKMAPSFVGPGNNGGDGLVIARHLHQLGGLPFGDKKLLFSGALKKQSRFPRTDRPFPPLSVSSTAMEQERKDG